MKLTGRNIKKRLYGVVSLPRQLSRIRYFRGHGVHSPFVYGIVRKVFMLHSLAGDDRRLYDELRGRGVGKRRAVELQNLFSYCGYVSFCVDTDDNANMCVMTTALSDVDVMRIVNTARENGTTIVVMSPYDSASRTAMCRSLVENHTSTSVDNRGYLLLFNCELPKQHFKI